MKIPFATKRIFLSSAAALAVMAAAGPACATFIDTGDPTLYGSALGGYGDGSLSFVGEAFVAQPGTLASAQFYLENPLSVPAKLRVEVAPWNGPSLAVGDLLFQSPTLTFAGPAQQTFIVDMGNTALTAGQTYVFLIDGITDDDALHPSHQGVLFGLNQNVAGPGDNYRSFVFFPKSNVTLDDPGFYAPNTWIDDPRLQLALKLTFGDPVMTVSEPGSAALLGVGLLGVFGVGRRRARRDGAGA